MIHFGTLQELFVHQDWARNKILDVAQPLDDHALNQPFEIGPGSLRAVLQHMYHAELFWLDKCFGPLEPELPPSKDLHSLPDFAHAYRTLAHARDALLDTADDDAIRRIVNAINMNREPAAYRVGDVLLHVYNHGVHHRAQTLNMLTRLGQQVPGLDYLFMAVEQPSVEYNATLRAQVQEMGFVLREGTIPPARLDVPTLQRYFAYCDWAQQCVFDAAAELSDDALDRTLDIGLHTLRATLTHITDAEAWWMRNWTIGPQPFEKLPKTTTIEEVRQLYMQAAAQRDAYVAAAQPNELLREVAAQVRPDVHLQFRVGESMIQLCEHGTHHRAQAVNMLRQLERTPPMLDLLAQPGIALETGPERA